MALSEEAAKQIADKPSPLGDLLSWIELLNGWGTIGLAIVVLSIGVMFWKLNSGATPYRIGDALIDPMTGKASILRTVIFGSFVGAWMTAGWYMLKGDDVKTFVLSLLGIFVTNAIANRAFETWDPRVKAQAASMSPPGESAPPPAIPEQSKGTP